MRDKGMLRRVDELGRVVIPKEIRYNLRIYPGLLIEFVSSNNGEIIMRKFHKLNEIADFAETCAKACAKDNNFIVAVCDTEKFVAVANAVKSEFIGKSISDSLLKSLRAHRPVILNDKETIDVFSVRMIDNTLREDTTSPQVVGEVILPIVVNGDLHGGIVFLSDKALDEVALGIGKAMSNFLCDYISD